MGYFHNFVTGGAERKEVDVKDCDEAIALVIAEEQSFNRCLFAASTLPDEIMEMAQKRIWAIFCNFL